MSEQSRKHGPFDPRYSVPPAGSAAVPSVMSSMDGTDRLDWSDFVALYYPGSHRHESKELAAYAAYRGTGIEAVDPVAPSAPVLVWEWEGGALESVPPTMPAEAGERQATGAPT